MIALLVLAVAIQAQDPVRVRAQLTQPEVQVGETTILRVEAQTDGPRAQIQPILSLPPGLELAGSRDFDQRQFSVPGGGRRFVTRDHVLRATQPGQFRVPAVEVIVDGRTYSTQPVLLTVAGAAPAAPGRTAPPAGADGVILRAWADADTVYVGEQLTVHVEAMFSQQARLRLRRAPEYEPPSPAGFWIHEIPDGRPPATRGTRGDVFETQTFRRAFFPLSPGRYEIPSARLFYEMRRGILQAPETFRIESDPLQIVVLPVPEQERPAEFNGAVGRFEVRAWLEPERLAAGDAAVLTLEVVGRGNIKTLPPPPLPDLPGFDVFPPTEESEVEIRDRVVQGRKRFSWVLVPREPGAVVMPEIRFASFDPETAGFHTHATPLPHLTVDPGAAGRAVAAPVSALRYLKVAPGSGNRLGWTRSVWFATAQAVPALALLVAVGFRRHRRAGNRSSSLALRRRRRARLDDLAARARSDDPGLLADAEGFAAEWLAERLDLDRRHALDPNALVQAGVDPATARALRAVLDRMAAARYAPAAPDARTRLDLVNALARIIDRVDRDAPRARRPAAPGPGAALIAALCIAGAGPAAAPTAAQAAPATVAQPASATVARPGQLEAPFGAGSAFFDAGRYAEAAAAFERHVQASGADAAGWYNLGTSHFRAGEPGRAIWAWLHALSLDPRDRDARHNLRAAGAAPELVHRVTSPVPLRAEELFLLASLVWFVAAAAGVWWVVRNGRGRLALAAAAAAVALGLAGAGARADRPPETLVTLTRTTLRAGPNLQADPVHPLEPGTGLVPIAAQAAWVRARTLAGVEGWVEIDLAAPVTRGARAARSGG